MIYTQFEYDKNGNIERVSAYNDTLLEYGMYLIHQVFYNARMQEYYVLPEYAYERY